MDRSTRAKDSTRIQPGLTSRLTSDKLGLLQYCDQTIDEHKLEDSLANKITAYYLNAEKT